MNTAITSDDNMQRRRREPDLDRRYGRIAISAVVAALPYRSEARNETASDAESREQYAD